MLPTTAIFRMLETEIIYIILPVFNRWHFTEACLLSLEAQTDTNYKVVVVDDGSTDGTLQSIARNYTACKLLQTRGDVFWTETVNVGIAWALADGATWVMTLNNDTLCPPTFLANMRRLARREILTGAVAIEKDTEVVTYGGELHNWWTNTNTNLLDILPARAQNGLQEVSHFPGRGLLIHKDVFAKVGLFDARNFPHYYADYDFTVMSKRAGFRVFANYDARLITYPEASGDKALRKKKSWDNYKSHLFGIRGGGNLVNFTRFALKNCPWYALPSHLALGYARRLLGYWAK